MTTDRQELTMEAMYEVERHNATLGIMTSYHETEDEAIAYARKLAALTTDLVRVMDGSEVLEQWN